MKAVISDNKVNLEGFAYFVGKASSISPGAWGDKKTPIGPGKLNYLDVWDVLPAPKLAQVKMTTTPLEVEFKDQKGLNLMAALSVPGLASGKVGLKMSDFSSGKVKLIKVSPVGEKELIRQINDSPKVLDKLIEFGGSARVVKDVLICVEAVLYSRFVASGASNGAVMIDGVMVRADRELGMDRSSEVRVGPGTVLAYSLAEPKWDATRDKNKSEVLDLRDDQQGL
ncbi:MAG: hypothetical protein KF788_05345 [Piscinibacter sp.]|nr:hypothetical protein [Piscinibacter sp.]